MTEIPAYIFPLIFLVAVLYSSVGHGGASGYLALMGLAGISLNYSGPIVLVLNCIVSIIAFAQYFHKGFFNTRTFGYLAIASVPCAYLGRSMGVSELWYKWILGTVLIFAAARLLLPAKNSDHKDLKQPHPLLLILIGGFIGFISGLINIGGGIILTPLLIFCRWSSIRDAAAVSALFIFVNSLSGLAAQYQKGFHFDFYLWILLGLAVSGALIGSYYGSSRWNTPVLKKILATGLVIASAKLLFL